MDEIVRRPTKAHPDGPEWYAVYTRSRFEKKVAAQLAERDVEHWLPLRREVREWKDRRKTVAQPLFPGYVFVRIHLADRLRVLKADGTVRLVGVGGTPVAIPPSEIEQVQRLLRHPELVGREPYANEGDRVKIVSGPFAGVEGRIVEVHGRHRVLVGVDLIRQAVSVEVDLRVIRTLPDKAA